MIYTSFGITLPSATSTLSQIGEWSSPVFNEFMPIAFFITGTIFGIILIGIIAGWIIGKIQSGIFDRSGVIQDKDNWDAQF